MPAGPGLPRAAPSVQRIAEEGSESGLLPARDRTRSELFTALRAGCLVQPVKAAPRQGGREAPHAGRSRWPRPSTSCRSSLDRCLSLASSWLSVTRRAAGNLRRDRLVGHRVQDVLDARGVHDVLPVARGSELLDLAGNQNDRELLLLRFLLRVARQHLDARELVELFPRLLIRAPPRSRYSSRWSGSSSRRFEPAPSSDGCPEAARA